MPRISRVVVVDTAHHITQRGNARRTVFETDSDRLAYLSLLQHYTRIHRLRILGYCLMPNHVHLIAVPEREDSMGLTLGKVHGRYSAYLNTRQQRTGHIWQNRYFSCAMDDRHLWTALRYVERNPVRAGLAREPEEFAWSSAAIHCADVASDAFVDLTLFHERWRCGEWRDFVAAESNAEVEAEQIRRSTRTGRPLGSTEFVAALEKSLHRSLSPSRGGRPRKHALVRAVGLFM